VPTSIFFGELRLAELPRLPQRLEALSKTLLLDPFSPTEDTNGAKLLWKPAQSYEYNAQDRLYVMYVLVL